MVGAWEDAPDEAMSANMAVPDEYRFDNPGEAVAKAEEMGVGDGEDLAGDELIHTHEDGDQTVFMPAQSHEALVEKLNEMGVLDDMSGNAIRQALATLRETLLADDGETPEAPAATANAADDGIDREDLIDDITANSPLTRDALEARCNDGLQAIHADVMAANNDTTDDVSDDTDTTMSDNSDDNDGVGLDDLTDNARETLVDEAVERIEANREDEQKEQLVSEIIANSADFDSDDRETLLDTPLEALKSLKPSGAGAAMPGTGATANAEPAVGGGDSADEYSDGTLGGDL
jgi:hypothetical protein